MGDTPLNPWQREISPLHSPIGWDLNSDGDLHKRRYPGYSEIDAGFGGQASILLLDSARRCGDAIASTIETAISDRRL
jgi:hypothetical protein